MRLGIGITPGLWIDKLQENRNVKAEAKLRLTEINPDF